MWDCAALMIEETLCSAQLAQQTYFDSKNVYHQIQII